jgi:hypothetical protein
VSAVGPRATNGYHPGVKRPVLRLIGLLGFGALAAQAGHLIVYQLEFGQAAFAVQSQGAHAYFPLLAKTGFGIGAAVCLGALLLIGAARLTSGSPLRRAVESPPYILLLSSLFTIQITFFVLQETIESMAAGEMPASAVHLVLIGSIGQLPVAVLMALALKWLVTRFETALIVLRGAIPAVHAPVIHVRLSQPRRQVLVAPILAQSCRSVFVKRGPPQNLPG